MNLRFFFVLLATGLLSFGLSFVTQRAALRFGAVSVPSGRRQHKAPTPQLGGLGIGLTLALFLLGGGFAGWFTNTIIHPQQLIGFGIGLALILAVSALDDVYDLPAAARFPLYGIACLIVVLAGTTVRAVTCLDGHACSLLWWQSAPVRLGGWTFQLSLPGDVLAWLWLFFVTFTTKLLDGLDGLVTGQTLLGTLFIIVLTLSPAFLQPPVALLAIIVFGSFAGFLPANFPPARQFLGESGSVLAGFSLAFLSLVSGAKMAIAFLALGLPLVDMLVVMLGRIRRGQPFWVGDRTHLHFLLQEAGLRPLQAAMTFWVTTGIFGAAALSMKTGGKILLACLMVLVTLELRAWCHRRIRARTGKSQAEYD